MRCQNAQQFDARVAGAANNAYFDHLYFLRSQKSRQAQTRRL
jgi:hypothetical protein